MTTSQTAPARAPIALNLVEPMLPVASAEPSDSPDRLYEIKWEGIRAVSVVDSAGVSMHTRGGKDLSPAFPEIVAAVSEAAGGADVVLDGELVALSDEGVPQRHAVVERWLAGSPLLAPIPVNYEIFDILYLNGRPLIGLPLYERKAILHDAIRPNAAVHLCHFEEGEGVAMYDAARELGLHGVVAKDKFSLYEPGKRSRHWLAAKHARTANLVVGGYTFGGSEQLFSSLLLGAYQDDELRYVGSVVGGFAKGGPALVYEMISQLHATDCPFDEEPFLDRFSYWCAPTLAVEVEYGERTPDGALRFLLFNSLRPDIPPRHCAIPI